MSLYEDLCGRLSLLTGCGHVRIVSRCNEAIKACFISLGDAEKRILIPEEGGWLTYRDYPRKFSLSYETIRCDDARVEIEDLSRELDEGDVSFFIYHHLGGYFAKQDCEGIYSTCKDHNVLVVQDVCGSLGSTHYVKGAADIVVGSFGRWKLVPAGVGGFFACDDEELFLKLCSESEELRDEGALKLIAEKLDELESHVEELNKLQEQVVRDLRAEGLEIIRGEDRGFVVIVACSSLEEKEQVMDYCLSRDLEWEECPRYIRSLREGVSIELKRK